MMDRWKKAVKEFIPQPAKRAIRSTAQLAQTIACRPRGYGSFLWNACSEGSPSGRARGWPVSITLEPANVCNLRCPVCETGAGTLGRPPQRMRYADFVTLLDKVGPTANHLMFYFMGEPFLNPDAYKMIRYARNMGLYVTTCTNGEPVDSEALYASGVNHVAFQIGGIRQETHERYRVRGRLEKVLDNLSRYLGEIKAKGRRPGEHEVELGFIVMKHNEEEAERFRAWAEGLGIDRATVVEPCVRTVEQGRELLPEDDRYWLYDRREFEDQGHLVPKRVVKENSCPWLYHSMTIQVNGDVVPCCRDTGGNSVVGNLLEQELDEIWNGERLRAFRRKVYTSQSTVTLCDLCPGYGWPLLR